MVENLLVHSNGPQYNSIKSINSNNLELLPPASYVVLEIRWILMF